MQVSTSAQWVQALQAVNQRSDGCSSYVIEVGLPRVSLAAWATATASATAAGAALLPAASGAAAASADGAAWFTGGSSVMSVAVPVAVSLNVTIRGVLGSSNSSGGGAGDGSAFATAGLPRVVLDAAYLLSVFEVVPPAVLTLQDVSLVRLASPRSGVLAAPLYFISRC